MKIVATVEARMGSSRLPGKVLLKASGKTMLEHLIIRLKSVSNIDEIVIATTTNRMDDPICELASRLNIKFFRGSEKDVLERVIYAAEYVKGDVVVEITGDCPIIDPGIIEQHIEIFKNNNVDYVNNVKVRSYPDGMDTQVIKIDALKKSALLTKEKLDREHVSLFIRNNPNKFSTINICSTPDLYWPNLGLTLDELEDYKLIKKIISELSKKNIIFDCKEIIVFLKNNNDLIKINENVVRKGNS